jgi:periplasmic protein TonB
MQKAIRLLVMGIVLIAWCSTIDPVFAARSPQAANSSPQTVHVGGDVKPPVKIKDAKPAYPAAALQQRIQGVVMIEATIGTDGKVKDTKVVRANPVLADAAVAAVRAWEFKPTVIDGHPVQLIMTIPINFVLQ